MEIFELVKAHLAILGLNKLQAMQPYPFLSVKLLGAFVAVVTNMIPSCIYFFFVASSFEEYIDSFFTSSGSTGIFVIFSIYVWKMKELFQYINVLHGTVNASKLMLRSKSYAWKMFSLINDIFRIRKSKIESNSRPNPSTSWKNQQNVIFFLQKIIARMFVFAETYCELFCLFHNRFGKWCVRVADFDVVKLVNILRYCLFLSLAN